MNVESWGESWGVRACCLAWTLLHPRDKTRRGHMGTDRAAGSIRGHGRKSLCTYCVTLSPISSRRVLARRVRVGQRETTRAYIRKVRSLFSGMKRTIREVEEEMEQVEAKVRRLTFYLKRLRNERNAHPLYIRDDEEEEENEDEEEEEEDAPASPVPLADDVLREGLGSVLYAAWVLARGFDPVTSIYMERQQRAARHEVTLRIEFAQTPPYLSTWIDAEPRVDSSPFTPVDLGAIRKGEDEDVVLALYAAAEDCNRADDKAAMAAVVHVLLQRYEPDELLDVWDTGDGAELTLRLAEALKEAVAPFIA